ncbi:MAG: DUF3604 domain-containing protein [Sphingomonadaceae bacterium]|nr:DUF3604 domain-containing protein [Sphingomonadaceae bacterium]
MDDARAAQIASDEEVTSGPAMKLLWGDTHLHTSNSSDAFAFGVRLGPEEALRFASGEEVTATMGMKAKLSRPLDFLVIADHSDGLAALKAIHDGPRFLLGDPLLERWHDELQKGPEASARVARELIDRFAQRTLPAAMMDPKTNARRTANVWTDHTSIVERYNRPGKFTAFMGFEYTLTPNGDNLHRVVILRDGKARADKVLPYSSLVGTTADMLWDYMDDYEKNIGGRMLAIPHNSNLSNGLMFQLTMPGGGPMTADYARRRSLREPLVEVTQIKGDSESHPFLSPNDEFVGFGTAGWDIGNLDNSVKKTDAMLGGDYVREALKRGLLIEQQTGVNPYKMGLIGSTDSHTGLATGDEDNFFGKFALNEPNAERASRPQTLGTQQAERFGWHYLAGGYTAVWATANTRAAIFDAMMRREVYATTGPRMAVRFFGGWDFSQSDFNGNWVKAGYARGVPMGGNLKAGDGSPRFMISALKDPEGANLDRVQVVKGWVDTAGRLQEQVFDVVWGDADRRIKASNAKLPPVGDTVDIAKASYTNSIGDPELRTVWTDPEFDPSVRAFYYLRVLEIPTPRWVLYDALRYGAKLLPGTELKSQERAYSSPIWYNPKTT